jgi:hypothetical protein
MLVSRRQSSDSALSSRQETPSTSGLCLSLWTTAKMDRIYYIVIFFSETVKKFEKDKIL